MVSTHRSLLDRLSAGKDRVAWERFVELYTPVLVAWCRGLGMSDADTADYVQDVFVVLVEKLPAFQYDSTRSFRAWLKTILMNSWRKHSRKEGRIRTGNVDPDQIPDTDPGQLLEDVEHRNRLVARALTMMQADFEATTWKACWEFVVNDRPAAEVATELGISINSVYLAKSRVLRHLRSELHGFLD